MKRYFALALALLFVGALCARAQNVDDQYVQIFNQIQDADAIAATEPAEALTKYNAARAALERLQKRNPAWNAQIVAFRLDYLLGKIAALSAKHPEPTLPQTASTNQSPTVQPHQVPLANSNQPAGPSTNVPGSGPQRPPAPPVTAGPAPSAAPADWELQMNTLKDQVGQLQTERANLEAKLKEALAATPAVADPQQLVRTQDKLKAVQRENELLKVSLSQKQKNSEPAEAKPDPALQKAVTDANRALAEQKDLAGKLALENQALQERLKSAQAGASRQSKKKNTPRAQDMETQLASARAQIVALEARAVPYTAEELALMKQPVAKWSSTIPNQGQHSIRELSPGAARLVVEAKRYYENGQYDKAESTYQDVLREDPKNVSTLANLAAIQVQAKRFDAAEATLKQALSLEPENAYCLSVQGRMQYVQGHYDQSLEVLSRAAQLDPQSAEIQNFLGLTLSAKGMRPAAEAALRKAVQLEPGYGSAHNNLAVVYLNQQPPAMELARWHYQKALASGFPRNPDLEKKLQVQ